MLQMEMGVRSGRDRIRGGERILFSHGCEWRWAEFINFWTRGFDAGQYKVETGQ